jgi:hypothetical protein
MLVITLDVWTLVNMCVSIYIILRNIRQYTNIWSTERGIYDVECNFNTMVKLDPYTCIHTQLGI